jgi:hypothetical protein
MPQTLHPALIIGLGGSGIEIVRRFRRRFLELHPDTPYVQFLGIDTAPQEQHRGDDVPELADDEFFWASRFDPSDYVGSGTIDDRREMKTWWRGYDGLPLQYVAAGAGQRRPIGRLAFFVHFPDLQHAIRKTIQQIFSSDTYYALETKYKHGLNVYVVSSTCGGTGTGMFLDVATVVRQISRDIQPSKEVKVRGLLLLPSTFIGTGQVAPAAAPALRANAFGALSELDYAMSISTKERGPISYPGGYVASRAKAAFDSCYLVGNQASSGAVFSDFDTILERAAMHMMIELASPLGPTGATHLDNITSTIREAPDYRGRPRLYSSFAAEWMELPSARLHVRWAKRFAMRTLARLRQTQRGDGEDRVKASFADLWHQTSYGHLRRLMDRDGMKAFLPDVTEEEEALRDIPVEGRAAADLVQRAGLLESRYRKALENVTDVGRGIENSLRSVIDEVEALVGRVLGEGSFQEARALLERIRTELDQWSTQAAADRGRIDAGAWQSEFARRVNELSPSALERFRSAKPGLVRKQASLVEDAISGAQQAAVAALRGRAATSLLAQDGLSSVRSRIEQLRERVERAYAVAEGANAYLERVREPALPPGTDAGELTDDRGDLAFEEPERITILEQQAKAPLTRLLEGNEPLTSDTLAARLYELANRVSKDPVDAFLATIPMSPRSVGERVNQLEPFVLFTGQWRSTDGARRTARLDLIGVPGRVKAQENEIRAGIEPLRRGDAQIIDHGDPDRVIMTGQTHGFPLFALSEVAECKHAFDAMPGLEQNLRFTLPEPEARRWDITPMSNEEAPKWFALALALKRIKREMQRYGFVQGEGVPVPLGQPSENPETARQNARNAFADSGYAAMVSREIEVRASKEGNEWLKGALRQWIEEEEPRTTSPDYPAAFRSDFDQVTRFYQSIQ